MTKAKQRKRNDLAEELDKAVAALKTQCKDAAFFDAQMERILSLKGQMDVKPVRVVVEEKDVVKEHKGDTYYIALTKKGAIYHTYGGYTVIADSRNCNALFTTLAGMVDYFEDEEGYVDKHLQEFVEAREADEGRKLLPTEVEETRQEAHEAIDTDCIAKIQVLNAPQWCFTDLAATYEIATTATTTLANLSERMMNTPLMEEDEEANGDFEDAVRGAEHLKKLIDEDKEGEK